MNTLYIMNVPMLSAHITNEETSGFFSGSVKKRWTIINNNVAINYGVHYLLCPQKVTGPSIFYYIY